MMQVGVKHIEFEGVHLDAAVPANFYCTVIGVNPLWANAHIAA